MHDYGQNEALFQQARTDFLAEVIVAKSNERSFNVLSAEGWEDVIVAEDRNAEDFGSGWGRVDDTDHGKAGHCLYGLDHNCGVAAGADYDKFHAGGSCSCLETVRAVFIVDTGASRPR